MKPTRFDKIVNEISFAVLVGMALLIAVFWNRIPDKIPLRYDFSGNVTGYGSKWSVLIMPVVAVVFYIIFAFVERTPPESWNTGVKVTSKNREWVYANTRHLMTTTKLLFIVLFAILTYYQAAQQPLNMLLPAAEVLLCFVNIIFWLVRASKKKR